MGVVFLEYPEIKEAPKDVINNDSRWNIEYRCKWCLNVVSRRAYLISLRFVGSSGRAYLFSHCINVIHGEVYKRYLLTGQHYLRDIHCKKCNKVLGWYYEFAIPMKRQITEQNTVFPLQTSAGGGTDSSPSVTAAREARNVERASRQRHQAYRSPVSLREGVEIRPQSLRGLGVSVAAQSTEDESSEREEQQIIYETEEFSDWDNEEEELMMLRQHNLQQRFKEGKCVLERNFIVETHPTIVLGVKNNNATPLSALRNTVLGIHHNENGAPPTMRRVMPSSVYEGSSSSPRRAPVALSPAAASHASSFRPQRRRAQRINNMVYSYSLPAESNNTTNGGSSSSQANFNFINSAELDLNVMIQNEVDHVVSSGVHGSSSPAAPAVRVRLNEMNRRASVVGGIGSIRSGPNSSPRRSGRGGSLSSTRRIITD